MQVSRSTIGRNRIRNNKILDPPNTNILIRYRNHRENRENMADWLYFKKYDNSRKLYLYFTWQIKISKICWIPVVKKPPSSVVEPVQSWPAPGHAANSGSGSLLRLCKKGLIKFNKKSGLPEPPIFEISGSDYRQIPAPTPTPTLPLYLYRLYRL